MSWWRLKYGDWNAAPKSGVVACAIGIFGKSDVWSESVVNVNGSGCKGVRYYG